MKWLARKTAKVSWSHVKSQRLTSQRPTRLTSNVSRLPPTTIHLQRKRCAKSCNIVRKSTRPCQRIMLYCAPSPIVWAKGNERYSTVVSGKRWKFDCKIGSRIYCTHARKGGKCVLLATLALILPSLAAAPAASFNTTSPLVMSSACHGRAFRPATAGRARRPAEPPRKVNHLEIV